MTEAAAGRGPGRAATRPPALTQLDIVATDVEASVAFYRRLGLEISDRSAADLGIRHAEVTLPGGFVLELDNRELARTYNAAWRSPGGSSRALIGFSLPTREAADRTYAGLTAAGYRGRQAPHDAFWGARYAIVADPDGHDVGLMSPIDPGRRTWARRVHAGERRHLHRQVTLWPASG